MEYHALATLIAQVILAIISLFSAKKAKGHATEVKTLLNKNGFEIK